MAAKHALKHIALAQAPLQRSLRQAHESIELEGMHVDVVGRCLLGEQCPERIIYLHKNEDQITGL
ncbi:MAG: hypothetical protein MUC61_01220 [Amoebophilaceae bacterium]|jgi:hypothetical protein|nr:hypothetical protein [Amoebophilaceae bacterium]